MALLTREQARAAARLPRESVEIESLGGSVIIRAMSGKELMAFRGRVQQAEGNDEKVLDIAVGLASSLVLDESDGAPLFSVEEAAALNAEVLTELMVKILGVSGVKEGEEELADAVKGSAETTNSPSGTESPATSGEA